MGLTGQRYSPLRPNWRLSLAATRVRDTLSSCMEAHQGLPLQFAFLPESRLLLTPSEAARCRAPGSGTTRVRRAIGWQRCISLRRREGSIGRRTGEPLPRSGGVLRTDPNRPAKPESTEDTVFDAHEDTFNLAHTDIGIHLRKWRCVTKGTIGLLEPRGRLVLIAEQILSGCGHSG